MCWSLCLIKLQVWSNFIGTRLKHRVFSCKICETLKNTFFYKMPTVAASVQGFWRLFIIYKKWDLRNFFLKIGQVRWKILASAFLIIEAHLAIWKKLGLIFFLLYFEWEWRGLKSPSWINHEFSIFKS